MTAPAALLALDPAGLGGAILLGPPDPARDAWLDTFRALLPPAAPFRRIPLATAPERFDGGLDLPATLAAGRPVREHGLLEQAQGGALLLASAERLPAALAACLAAALDRGRSPALLALDERATDGEATPPALAERLAFIVDPRVDAGVDLPLDLTPAQARLPHVEIPEPLLDAICRAAAALGIASLRAPLLAVRAARAAAALAGRLEATEDDAALAARLVLAPRATRLPEPPPDPTPPTPDETPRTEDAALADRVLDAARTALPPNLLASLASAQATRSKSQGRHGNQTRAAARGRRAGTRQGDPRAGHRLALLATIRAALPWQRLRPPPPVGRLAFRPADLRVERRRPRAPTTTIFLVDASGSQAVGRLAEAKGAVLMLLADCYIRRDNVALVAFRGHAAEILLPPTRSLARARRHLAALPGGGPTPLAAGLDAGLALADATARRGATPAIVLLTDGSANIARDGQPGRAAAAADAADAARRLRAAGHRALLVDSALRPQPAARKLAADMGARYVPLPFAGAQLISGLARAG